MELSRLYELCTRYNDHNIEENGKLPGLSIFRRDAVSDFEAFIYEPIICLVLQGSKVTYIGDQAVKLQPGDAMLVSHDLPVTSQIIEASVETPYLAIILSLDLELVRSLYDQVADAPIRDRQARSLASGPADTSWLTPLIRYMELKGNPLDAKVLGPSILREIHYRLLLSAKGQMLRNLLAIDSHASRIARAIKRLISEFRSPLSVSDLAKTAGMSTTSFHEHFKTITGTTPIRYQKDLRLIEARTLLVSRKFAVSAAAFAVGYESPTHFSRDYRRKFGLPPSKELSLSVSTEVEGEFAMN